MASWIAFGVAGIGAVASAVFTVQLVDAQHSYQSHPTQTGRDDFYRNVALTDVALGITAAAAITGVVLWVTAPTSSNKTARGFRTAISF